ncbi:VapC toxin family PIN domain ribonuclease [Pseudomonas sp. WN033]|nr:VapC toxin family PIN domain ribonuclease [Pseudomonas sp. WN033]
MNVLVDTSVWVSHFKKANESLVSLLLQDRVLTHAMVIGELACGTPPSRQQTFAALSQLEPAVTATNDEVMSLIDREQLFGLGCGWVDISLLASALITPACRLWTLDKRLAKLAARFEVGFPAGY